MVKIFFEKSNDKYSFTDALNLPDDHGYTEQEIEDMKQKRFDNWLAIITAEPDETESADVTQLPAGE